MARPYFTSFRSEKSGAPAVSLMALGFPRTMASPAGLPGRRSRNHCDVTEIVPAFSNLMPNAARVEEEPVETGPLTE